MIGPDEYHEPVDDNAYTNVLARWNLRRAADMCAWFGDQSVTAEECARWISLADALVDGYQPETGVYEEFAGFFKLEPIRIVDIVERRPITADLLLGRDRVHNAQIVKQADVLMLHHLLPDEVEPGSLVPNLEYYEPRTAHGSSLSPGIHASLFARANRLDEAVEALRLAANIDLADLTATSGGGLAPRDDGWRVAGARVRISRAPTAARRLGHRPAPPRRMARDRGPGRLPRQSDTYTRRRVTSSCSPPTLP